MNFRLLRSALAVLALGMLGGEASAHIRWFTESGAAFADAEYAMDMTNGLVVLGAILYVAFAVYLETSRRFEKVSAGVAAVAKKGGGFDWRMVASMAGVMLIGNAMMGIYLAPNLDLMPESLAPIGAAAQILVGALLILQVTFSICGILILVVALLTTVLVEPLLLLDYVFEFVGLSLALIFVGPRYCKVDRALFKKLGLNAERYEHLAVPILRVAVGLTLGVLALHNKLLNPGLTLAFLAEYNFNFMAMAGVTAFDDLHFAFAAGVGELTFGLLMIFGMATRFVVAGLAVFFVITMIVLMPVELVGHLPLVAIAVMLILRGNGELAPVRVVESERVGQVV